MSNFLNSFFALSIFWQFFRRENFNITLSFFPYLSDDKPQYCFIQYAYQPSKYFKNISLQVAVTNTARYKVIKNKTFKKSSKKVRFLLVRTEPQFHQNIGQHRDSIIDKLHISPTNIVNYKYTDHHSTMKPLYRNKVSK